MFFEVKFCFSYLSLFESNWYTSVYNMNFFFKFSLSMSIYSLKHRLEVLNPLISSPFFHIYKGDLFVKQVGLPLFLAFLTEKAKKLII